MLHRLLSPLVYVTGDTKPDILLSVEKSLADPTGAAITFSAYNAYTHTVDIDHEAGSLEDISSEIDVCTGETLWNFKLRHTPSGALQPGLFYCNFALNGTWHSPATGFQLKVVSHGA